MMRLSLKQTVCLILLSICVLAPGCRRKPATPLRIACHADLMPVVTLLGEEYRKDFGLPMLLTPYDEDGFPAEDSVNFDFLITDDLSLVERLRNDGTVSSTACFGYATPAMVFRRDDNLMISDFEDLAAVEQTLRMTVASDHGTLLQIVKAAFERNDIPLQGEDAKFQLQPFLTEEILSDGTRIRTTADTLLQQLRDNETDIVVVWDFAALEAVKGQPAGEFAVFEWPKDGRDTITIPVCLLQNCGEFSDCKVFIDFVNSKRGNELLRSCSLTPCDAQ